MLEATKLLDIVLQNGPNIAIVVLCILVWINSRDIKEIKADHNDCHRHVSEYLHKFGEHIGHIEGKLNGHCKED